MQQAKNRNFHVPLPDEIYQVLRLEAERRQLPATVLVREAVEEWVERLRAQVLHAEIADYAAKHAGSAADIDVQLEAAGIESLIEESTRVRRARRQAKRK
jgi:predicted DNA-binding protein